jgi:hypothetical protein
MEHTTKGILRRSMWTRRSPKNRAKASAAAVAKDEDSNFLGMSTLILEGCADPETTEVVACHKGLALAIDLDL